MKVFRVSPDVSSFQTLVPTDEAVWASGILDFDCRRKEQWHPIDVVVLDPFKTRGNFFYLSPSALVFDTRAFEALDDLLEMAGEVLPLGRVNGGDLHLLNVLECVSSLDPERSQWRVDVRTSKRLGIDRYVFRSTVLSESSVFKIPETSRAEVLTYSGLRGQSDEFVGRYLASGLEGLRFDALFESGTVHPTRHTHPP